VGTRRTEAVGMINSDGTPEDISAEVWAALEEVA
jgi:hypothetical protein